ncbi:MAG: N-6 DNA methylase [Deltaproteobacteria bacterium]|nr:N-6 DNA methylase [Deltaproteobacteria bacterium]
MARTKNGDPKKINNGANVGYEAELWQMADALRGSMDAAEYKHVVLGLIFLKYISDAFEEQHEKLEAQKSQGADPEDPDEYRALNIFWVPPEARWSHLKAQAKQPTIGQIVDDAMSGIERDNPSLKGVLPKDYARPGLDKQRLGQIIDLIANIKVGDSESRSKDVLGQVYQYFLKQFALAEGRKGGEFWTPQSVVRLLVEMLEPYKGRVYDPCSGTGGMFVQSVRFIDAHAKGNGNGGKAKGAISIYGQESNYTTWRLARMNLAIRGIDAQIAHGDTFHNDRHPDLRADFILANPHFNDSDWRGELLRDDKRWQFGKAPASNANFAWVQHIIHHLAPMGLAGFVLANGSMSSNQSGEGEIRKNIIEADLVDCMIALPGQLFYSTQIPACLWFIARDKRGQPSPRTPLPLGEGQYRGGLDFSGQLELARSLRKNATPAESVAWELLRDRRFLGLKFRRQHQIGDYIVDFFCDEKKLVVELDGPVHDTDARKPIDQKRNAYMKSLGLTVLRIANQRLLDSTEQVLNEIAQSLSPSPYGRGTRVRVNGFRDRRGEILFIDARKLGVMADRTHRELTDDEITRIAQTYHAWRGETTAGKYIDVPGFCMSAKVGDIRKHGHVLTPGRYVGAEAQEDDGEPFEKKMQRLTATLREQQAAATKLDAAIAANLKELGYGG